MEGYAAQSRGAAHTLGRVLGEPRDYHKAPFQRYRAGEVVEEDEAASASSAKKRKLPTASVYNASKDAEIERYRLWLEKADEQARKWEEKSSQWEEKAGEYKRKKDIWEMRFGEERKYGEEAEASRKQMERQLKHVERARDEAEEEGRRAKDAQERLEREREEAEEAQERFIREHKKILFESKQKVAALENSSRLASERSTKKTARDRETIDALTQRVLDLQQEIKRYEKRERRVKRALSDERRPTKRPKTANDVIDSLRLRSASVESVEIIEDRGQAEE